MWTRAIEGQGGRDFETSKRFDIIILRADWRKNEKEVSIKFQKNGLRDVG